MTHHRTPGGGRTGVRRLRIGAAVTLAVLLSGARPAAAHEPDVNVREADGLYVVSARFQVPQPPAIALTVLTDYEEIPRFMPGVRSSIVLERAGRRVVVEQEAVARLLMFSRRVHLLLEVHEGTDRVAFRDASGRSFERYEGVWRLARREGGTVISYELTARPAFSVPEFLLTRLLRRDARQMIERLCEEIAARPSDVTAGA